MAETATAGAVPIVHRLGGTSIDTASIVLTITRPLLFGRQKPRRPWEAGLSTNSVWSS